MHNQIIINKHNPFPFGQGIGAGNHRTSRPLSEGFVPAVCTLPDDREDFEHGRGDDPQGSAQALGCDRLRRADLLVHPFVDNCAREHRPKIVRHCPALLLEEGPKVRLLKPETFVPRRVLRIMLGQSNPLEGLTVEPIHIRVRIPRIPRSSIHLTPVNRPEIRHDIEIVLRDPPFHVIVDNPRAQQGLHCGLPREPSRK
jgi:hypothetical protein